MTSHAPPQTCAPHLTLSTCSTPGSSHTHTHTHTQHTHTIAAQVRKSAVADTGRDGSDGNGEAQQTDRPNVRAHETVESRGEEQSEEQSSEVAGQAMQPQQEDTALDRLPEVSPSTTSSPLRSSASHFAGKVFGGIERALAGSGGGEGGSSRRGSTDHRAAVPPLTAGSTSKPSADPSKVVDAAGKRMSVIMSDHI